MKEKVFVAIYSHEYGTDTRIFKNEENAWKWRDSIATDYWINEFPDDEMPAENVGQEYFSRMLETDGREYFEVLGADIED